MIKQPLGAALSALALVGVTAVTPTTEAHAAAPGYHTWNVIQSYAPLHIYSGSNCTGSIHIVYQGQKTQSDGWDSAQMFGVNGVDDVHEIIYDIPTGRYLATRHHDPGECWNLSNNAHRVQGTL